MWEDVWISMRCNSENNYLIFNELLITGDTNLGGVGGVLRDKSGGGGRPLCLPALAVTGSTSAGPVSTTVLL